MKEMLSKALDTKQTTLTFLVNFKKIIKNKKKNRWFDRIRTKTFSGRMVRQNRRVTSEPNGNLQVFKVGFKVQSHMFGLSILKQKNNFLGISGHLSIFLIDAKNSFWKNASMTYFKFVETRPRDNKIL